MDLEPIRISFFEKTFAISFNEIISKFKNIQPEIHKAKFKKKLLIRKHHFVQKYVTSKIYFAAFKIGLENIMK